MRHKHIFRMTYFRNMPIFIRDGHISAKNHRPLQKCFRTSYADIVQRRDATSFYTPCNSSVNDFVPFYFSPLTAMAYTISSGNVRLVDPEGHDLGIADMQDLIFLVCDLTKLAELNLQFWFSDVACNTLSQIPNYDDNLSNLEAHVDWTVFDENPKAALIPEIGYAGVCKWQQSNDAHPNRGPKRMAEFLIKDFLPLESVECIITKREDIARQIEVWLANSGYDISVYTKAGCYY